MESTIRERVNRRGALLLALLVAAASGVAFTPESTVAAEPAEIVFESGARVISIDATGGNRKNLTPWKELDAWGSGTMPSMPSISPDGTKIAFLETFYVKGWPNTRVYVSDRDGRNRKVVRNSRWFPLKASIWDLSWDPAGRLVLVEYLQGGTKLGYNLTRVVSMRPSGTGRRIELKRVYRGVRDFFIIDAEMSPASGRLLFTAYRGTGISRLEVLDRSTGKVRILRRRASGGSWSPDGKLVLFESDKTGVRNRCLYGRCFGDTKIFISRSDGKGPARRLTRGKSPGNESGASWSPDGSRIAFASDRNNPMMAVGNGREVYTVNPDGSCLTWLTNGTPASSSPTWGPEQGRSPEPGQCGASHRPPLVELVPDAKPLVNGELTKWPRLWLGTVFNGRAQSFDTADGRELGYSDCVRYEPEACKGPEWSVSSDDVCLDWVGQSADFGSLGQIVERRGTLVILPDFKRRGYEALVLTGGQVVMLTPERRRARPQASRDAYLKAVDSLRPVGKETSDEDLEPPVISRKTVVTARQVAATVKRAGSIHKAATELGHRPHQVRDWLNLNQALEKAGPMKTVTCKGWFGASA